MKLRRKNKIAESYVTRCDEMIKAGRMDEAAKVMNEGLDHYTRMIAETFCPYRVADSGMIAGCLRNLATTLEESSPGAKKMSDYIVGLRKPKAKQKIVKMPKPKRH